MKKFWNWTNSLAEENEPAERILELYGTIASESWFDDDITPQIFKEELFSGTGDIVLYISSPGGDCIAASQIYTMLMDYPGNVTVKIDGVAASSASVIAMAGTRVLMAPTGMLMIHNPSTMACGDHNDMQKAIDLLAEVKESIINAYEIKTGLPRKELAKLMENETWMNARKAMELGFADGILEDSKRDVPQNAYTFSESTVANALNSKLTAKYGAPRKTEPKPTGRSVNELMGRLNLLKH